MPLVTILPDGGNRVRLDPSDLVIVQGETVVFRNEDPNLAHWITLAGRAQNFWFKQPLAPFYEGEPAATTPDLLFNDEPPNGDTSITYTYDCIPGGVRGTIVVNKPT
jgi:plastocyanin